ncbi:unnamed protein product [Amoebophrya sp. A25]|nr:unnamed protein product [Amoebophrya sp. A25]|eukprot:GSA25T00010991001.1
MMEDETRPRPESPFVCISFLRCSGSRQLLKRIKQSRQQKQMKIYELLSPFSTFYDKSLQIILHHLILSS